MQNNFFFTISMLRLFQDMQNKYIDVLFDRIFRYYIYYWANGLFYPSWNLQLIGSSVADCQALT